MIKQWGGGASWSIDGAANLHEAQILKLDCTKAKLHLGWSPKLGAAEAVDWAIEWYKAFAQKKTDMCEMTREHIARFQELK